MSTSTLLMVNGGIQVAIVACLFMVTNNLFKTIRILRQIREENDAQWRVNELIKQSLTITDARLTKLEDKP